MSHITTAPAWHLHCRTVPHDPDDAGVVARAVVGAAVVARAVVAAAVVARAVVGAAVVARVVARVVGAMVVTAWQPHTRQPHASVR